VPATGGAEALAECLESFAAAGSPGLEVVVVLRGHASLPRPLEGRWGGLRVVGVPESTPLAAMRLAGLRAARGGRVSVLGEHLRPGPDWVAALASSLPSAVVGGPIEAGSGLRAAEWAFFLLEYARFSPPIRPGSASALAGTNCSYSREALDRLKLDEGPDELFDHELHARLRAQGETFAVEPRLVARCEKRLGAARFLSQRFHCARVFAARRAASWPAVKRWAFALASPLLPPLLLARLVATLGGKRQHAGGFLRALPLILAGLIVGAFGEAAGALRGPGRSAALAE
jgi:hypothetical protein